MILDDIIEFFSDNKLYILVFIIAGLLYAIYLIFTGKKSFW